MYSRITTAIPSYYPRVIDGETELRSAEVTCPSLTMPERQGCGWNAAGVRQGLWTGPGAGKGVLALV